MSDSERDAWLREALRHAPDSGALPPNGVSEAILAEARAAARSAAPRRVAPRAARANAFAALWAWLAQPPVAAGFASVMAATLVGLMWWDQPMDQTIARAPAPVSDRAGSMPTGSMQADSARPPSTQPIVAEPGSTSAGAMASSETRRRSSAADTPGRAVDAKEVAAAPAIPPTLKNDERASEGKLQAKRPSDAPAPFPASEQQRESEKATVTVSPGREAAKKEADLDGLRADAMTQPSAPPAAPAPMLRQAPSAQPEATAAAKPAAVVGAAAPAPAARMQSSGIAAAPAPAAPFQGSGITSETSDASPAGRADASLAKSAAAPPRAAAPARDAAPPSARNANDAVQDALTSPAERVQRQRALADSRDKDVAALAPAPSAPAPFRNEIARSRADAATRPATAAKSAPPSSVIAAIAAEPDRWSRQTAAGDVALEPGWRRWLAELDAATSGRWRSTGPGGAAADSNDRAAANRLGTPTDRASRADAATGADPARDRATSDRPTTLRLVDANRAAVVIRVDGATVHVDTTSQSGAERWQATLDPAATDALRSAARRLPP